LSVGQRRFPVCSLDPPPFPSTVLSPPYRTSLFLPSKVRMTVTFFSVNGKHRFLSPSAPPADVVHLFSLLSLFHPPGVPFPSTFLSFFRNRVTPFPRSFDHFFSFLPFRNRFFSLFLPTLCSPPFSPFFAQIRAEGFPGEVSFFSSFPPPRCAERSWLPLNAEPNNFPRKRRLFFFFLFFVS